MRTHIPINLTEPNHHNIRTREYQDDDVFPNASYPSLTGESYHQTMKEAKGKNTDFESGEKPGQKNLGDFIKGGASVHSPTSDDHISQLQKDGIWAVCTHMHAHTHYVEGKGWGGDRKRDREFLASKRSSFATTPADVPGPWPNSWFLLKQSLSTSLKKVASSKTGLGSPLQGEKGHTEKKKKKKNR